MKPMRTFSDNPARFIAVSSFLTALALGWSIVGNVSIAAETTAAARADAKEQPKQEQLEQIDVFIAGQDGYHTYRIPSVIVTQAGTVLAFCEGRVRGQGDSGDIDLLVKRSEDGGRTFSQQRVIWDDQENTCGNPCPVVVRETGEILLLMTHNLGTDNELDIKAKTSRGKRTVWLSKSFDDGKTWSAPREITNEAKKPDWAWYATGPGAGIQLRDGRIVIPSYYTPGGVEPGVRLYFSHIIFSDSRGDHWKIGGIVGPHCNECEAVELADGAVMLNMRSYKPAQPHRAVAASRDRGETFGPINHDPILIEPICQASIRRYSMPEGDRPGRILFSNPASRKREKLNVRLSLDEAETWCAARVLHEGPAAYSCLAVLPDGTVLCLYERGEKHPYERITLARFGIGWLESGRSTEPAN